MDEDEITQDIELMKAVDFRWRKRQIKRLWLRGRKKEARAKEKELDDEIKRFLKHRNDTERQALHVAIHFMEDHLEILRGMLVIIVILIVAFMLK